MAEMYVQGVSTRNVSAIVEELCGTAVSSTQVSDCPSRLAAEQRLKELVAHYANTAPKLATWLEENLPQGFAVFTLPAAHQQRMRTSNALERVN